MKIIDMDDCQESKRHARYLGNAGDKDGIIYNGENWIVKYPKSTKAFQGNNLATYTTSPLSEYIGSKIYEILGIDVHKTELCFRNNQIAVACKDFQKNWGDLLEIRGIKNSANKQIFQEGEELPISATGDSVNLEELFLHFEKNPFLNNDYIKEQLQERFWDCVIIDILIDNNDRNNGNWGLLYNEDNERYELAPVYDNGNSFSNKLCDKRLKEIVEENNINQVTGTRTVYSYQDKILSSKKILEFDNEILKQEILKIVPQIKEHLKDIRQMINDIPEEYRNLSVCNDIKKNYYIFCLKERFEKILEPVYIKVKQEMKNNIEKEDPEEIVER